MGMKRKWDGMKRMGMERREWNEKQKSNGYELIEWDGTQTTRGMDVKE